MNKENLNTNAKNEQSNDVFELKCSIEEAVLGLDELPELVDLFIKAYNLQKLDFTDEDRYSLGTSRPQLFALLSTINRRIYAIQGELDKLIKD